MIFVVPRGLLGQAAGMDIEIFGLASTSILEIWTDPYFWTAVCPPGGRAHTFGPLSVPLEAVPILLKRCRLKVRGQ